MKYTIFCRLGMMFLALSFVLGCKYPTETTYIEIPVEIPIMPVDPEDPPEITGFTFTQASPLQAAYSVKDKTAGSFSDPVGGTPPFTYALAEGDGINDTDNPCFVVSGNSLKIQAGHLAAGAYFVCLGITDSMEMSYTQAASVTVAPDPVALDQQTRTVGGVNLKMRYVPSGSFIEPSMEEGDIEVVIQTGFWMAETEVTQELYQFIMGKNPSQFRDNPAPEEVQNQRPVENVLWYEAVLFCNRLSMASGREPVYSVWGVPDWAEYLQWAAATGSTTARQNIRVDEKANGYRLPGVAEWYWAAMGADTLNPGQVNSTGIKKYYAGGSVENGVGSTVGIEYFAWYRLNSLSITHEVGKKLPNELGIFDLTGNVNEWTWEGGLRGQDWNYPGNIPFYLMTFGNSGGIRIVSNQ